MKCNTKSIWGKVPEPESVEELFSAIIHPLDGRPGVRFWRGQSDISWRLDSSLYRRLQLQRTRAFKLEAELQFAEAQLLERARHKGHDAGGAGIELPDMELLARLQHHGAATRLVDFTRNALVGLYFACEGLPAKHGALIGLHTEQLGGYEGERERASYREAMALAKKRQHPLTWEPTNVSPRIAAQHAQLCYSAAADDPRGSLRLPEGEGALLVLAIAPALKARALEVLSHSFDMGPLSLFPDLDGFCQAHGCRRNPDLDYRW